MQETSTIAQETRNNAVHGKSPWIVSPLVDYLFVSGGMLWFLWLLAYEGLSTYKTDPASIVFGTVMLWGSILIAEAHGPATLARAFTSPSTPKRTRNIIIIAFVILVMLGLPCLTNQDAAAIFLKITLLWGVQHYTAQTYGVVMIYCLKRGFALSNFERLLLQNLLRAQLIFVLVRAFSDPKYGAPNFLGLNVPFWGPLPWGFQLASEFILVFMILISALMVARRYLLSHEIMPLPAVLAVVSVIALTYLARDTFYYLIGVYFLHSSQYLVIAYSYFIKEQAVKQGIAMPGNGWKLFVSRSSIIYFVCLIAVGYAMSGTGTILAMFKLPLTLSVVTAWSVYNCHHFLADALIWRIRNDKVKELLI